MNGSPGAVRWEVVDATPDPDVTRASSSQSYGSGGGYSVYEVPFALRPLGNGVIDGYANELAVSYDGAGLDIDIATGAALVMGIPCVFYDATDLSSVGTRDATHPKACYVVLEVTPLGNADEGKAELKVSCGTAAASPALPSLTQNETLYQLALASYQLPNTSSTTLTSFADLRTFANSRNPTVSDAERRSDPASETTTTGTSNATASGLSGSISLVPGVTYDVEVRTAALVKINTAAQSVGIAPFINTTGEVADAIFTNSTGYVLLSNVHTAEVVGAGSMSYGTRWRVTGGTGTLQTGVVSAIARPRK